MIEEKSEYINSDTEEIKDKMSVDKCMKELRVAATKKAKLVNRQYEDFLFALGKQWKDADLQSLKAAGIEPITDNRIQPNIFLLTGLERQNRTEFKAFPVGHEDGLKAEIATALFKDAVNKSEFAFKSSDQFKDGVTCGECHLEPYLDYSESLINGKLKWAKVDSSMLFADPASREYDLSDASFIFKVIKGLNEEELINLYPNKEKEIRASKGGKFDFSYSNGIKETQSKGYGSGYGEKVESVNEDMSEKSFDLAVKQYKKYVTKYFVGDWKTGHIKEAETKEKADAFINEYKAAIEQEQMDYQMAAQNYEALLIQGVQTEPPPAIEVRDPERYKIIKKNMPEVWVYEFVPGISEPLKHERAWWYPKWKGYSVFPYFARFSTAPLDGDDRHLLIQGIVHGVKGAQEKHNKAENLIIRHLNTSTNSGWISEEGAWVDKTAVENLGTAPGVVLEYKKGHQRPERITAMPLSQGHAQISLDSAEAIKANLGMNSDLIAAQQSSGDSGRAIALRQRQGLLMVQELFDNLSRTRQTQGRFILTQLGEMYDTELASKILGEDYLAKNFPPRITENLQNVVEPIKNEYGEPEKYDRESVEFVLNEVLSGDVEKYDVSVGESVASETMLIAQAAEVKEIATAYPGIIGPDVIIEHSQLPQNTKNKILSRLKAAQAPAGPVGPVPTQQPEGIEAML